MLNGVGTILWLFTSSHPSREAMRWAVFGAYPSDQSGELGGPLQTKMMEIFGATEEDFRELRIASLEAEDIDRLEALMGRGEAGGVDDDTDDDEDEAGRLALLLSGFCIMRKCMQTLGWDFSHVRAMERGLFCSQFFYCCARERRLSV